MNEKLLTINKLAKLCGITVRTLHYYDEIGLLSPNSIAPNGYREYDQENLIRLQSILFFKELDIPLKEIKRIIDSPNYDKHTALKKHKKLLALKRERLDRIINLVDDNLEKDEISLKEFDMTNIKEQINKYQQEAKERWGDTEAFKQSSKRTSKYSTADWQKINEERDNIFSDFADSLNNTNDCKDTDVLVKEWKNHISRYYYDCTDEILSGLADMYMYDGRFKENMDKHGEGLTEFISKSIKNYCNKK